MFAILLLKADGSLTCLTSRIVLIVCTFMISHFGTIVASLSRTTDAGKAQYIASAWQAINSARSIGWTEWICRPTVSSTGTTSIENVRKCRILPYAVNLREATSVRQRH